MYAARQTAKSKPVTLKKALRERILVVKQRILFGARNERYFKGFKPLTPESEIFIKLVLDCHEFLPRAQVETDSTYKQVIIYNIFVYGNKVFVYKRTRKSADKRLYHMYSIGVGGHVNERDKYRAIEKHNLLAKALRREFHEEILYRKRYDVKFVGFINDDSNAIGRVHFGLVYLLKGSSPEINVKKGEVTAGRLKAFGEIKYIASKMETWSKICLLHLRKLI